MKRKVPTKVAEGFELARELLRSTDVPADLVPSWEVPVSTRGDAAELTAELEKTKTRAAELNSVETITVRRHRELMEKGRQRHAEEVSVWKEPSRENAHCLANTMKDAKADIVKIYVERNLNLARFEKHVRAVQTLVDANVERKVTFTDAMAKIRELLESDFLINSSRDYSERFRNKFERYNACRGPGRVEGFGVSDDARVG